MGSCRRIVFPVRASQTLAMTPGPHAPEPSRRWPGRRAARMAEAFVIRSPARSSKIGVSGNFFPASGMRLGTAARHNDRQPKNVSTSHERHVTATPEHPPKQRTRASRGVYRVVCADGARANRRWRAPLPAALRVASQPGGRRPQISSLACRRDRTGCRHRRGRALFPGSEGGGSRLGRADARRVSGGPARHRSGHHDGPSHLRSGAAGGDHRLSGNSGPPGTTADPEARDNNNEQEEPRWSV